MVLSVSLFSGLFFNLFLLGDLVNSCLINVGVMCLLGKLLAKLEFYFCLFYLDEIIMSFLVFYLWYQLPLCK